ncbi:MAG: ABC transporter substrate-binding protein [Acetobacteraceae bacterium]|nr:ABC transporter substrate-binding protein [Acetobacteraceae bacterium]
MRRRTLFAATAATTAAALAAPRLAPAQAPRTLKFVAQAGLAVLDPIWSTGFVTRNHGLMVWDTLYGWDDRLVVQPQMVEGHTVSDDGRQWDLRLREGLRFHDDTPVLARDCVASLGRWGRRDTFGLAMMTIVDEISAPDDRTIRFRLKRPFPLLPEALGKGGTNTCFMMPERIAKTDPFQQIPEVIGSGPFRYVVSERVPGSLDVYARFEGYVPRPSGTASFIAGPKVAHFDRVEWRNLPDASTAAAALQTGEIDWWEQPPADLVPVLARNRQLKLEVIETSGFPGVLRFNHLHPPFDNPAIRRAVVMAVNQADFMQAVAGADHKLWRDDIGFLAPGGVMANDEGMQALQVRSTARAKQALEAAGYKGEKVVHLHTTDFPPITAMGLVAADMMRNMGLNVDVVATDWGTTLRRIVNTEPPDRGGWNSMCTFTAATSQINPAAHNFIRGTGRNASFGWSTSPGLEKLRDEWLFEASDDDSRRRIGREIQRQAFIDVPYIPLGLWYQNTAYRANLSGMLKGLPLFWNLRRA